MGNKILSSDGKAFEDIKQLERYERSLMRVPVSVFSNDDIHSLTSAIYASSYQMDGRQGQNMTYNYYVSENETLAVYDDNGRRVPAHNIAVVCSSSRGVYDPSKEKQETILLYSFCGLGNVVVVPVFDIATTEMPKFPKNFIAPIFPFPNFNLYALTEFFFNQRLFDAWDESKRPINKNLSPYDWTLLFTKQFLLK